jgi:hypothetical protein
VHVDIIIDRLRTGFGQLMSVAEILHSPDDVVSGGCKLSAEQERGSAVSAHDDDTHRSSRSM